MSRPSRSSALNQTQDSSSSNISTSLNASVNRKQKFKGLLSKGAHLSKKFFVSKTKFFALFYDYLCFQQMNEWKTPKLRTHCCK